MLERVTAVRFHRRLGSGRTRPCIVFCADGEGEEVELVVKFAGGCELKHRSLLCEALSSMLADDLELPVPKPYAVDVTVEFSRSVSSTEMSPLVEQSLGWNFGCAKLPPGFNTWPVDRPIPLALRPLAAEVFAFDALIQNPDRRRRNPNCLVRGEELAIFDHELALSFLATVIGGRPRGSRVGWII